jgi:hypothetical protein
MSNLIQCEICQKWCFNKRSLLTHLGFCRQRHTAFQDDANHVLHEHNPLQSRYNRGDHLNPFAVYDDLDLSNSDDDSVVLDNNMKDKVSRGQSIYPDWKTNPKGVKSQNYKFRLLPKLVSAIINKVRHSQIEQNNRSVSIKGHTRLRLHPKMAVT